MRTRERKWLRRFGKLLFLLYIVFLFWFLLFSDWYGRGGEMREYHYNLELFREIRRFWTYREQLGFLAFANLAGNVLIFVPFGFFMPMASRSWNRSFFLTVFYSFGISFFVEVFQLLTKVGSFDVDDLVDELPVCGGVGGCQLIAAALCFEGEAAVLVGGGLRHDLAFAQERDLCARHGGLVGQHDAALYLDRGHHNDACRDGRSRAHADEDSGTAAAKEAANMVDLDSDPTKILEVVEIGKQLLITRGSLTTFSIANDIAKYFAIIPAMFMMVIPQMQVLNIMKLASPTSAILSALIFNAIIIPCLIPLAMRGVKYKPMSASKMLTRNMLIYGLGGVIVPFIGIKVIDLIIAPLLTMLGLGMAM